MSKLLSHAQLAAEFGLTLALVDAACGVDEAGRGPLAGPVVVAAVVLDPTKPIDGLDDSKQLTPEQRERLEPLIRANARQASVVVVSAAEVDQLNVLGATLAGMARAVAALGVAPALAFIDGDRPPRLSIPLRTVIRGDSRVPAIAAASILAKVARDALMVELDAHFPGYGFARHKGYPTPDHLAALKQLGPCAEHRRSFGPVRTVIEGLRA